MNDSRAQTDAKVKDNNLNLKMNLKLIRVSLICDMKDNFPYILFRMQSFYGQQNALRIFYIPCMVFYALAGFWLLLAEIATAMADETLGTNWNIASHLARKC